MKFTIKAILKVNVLMLILFSLKVSAQSTPTVTSFTPTTVTQRTIVTITGTNFTASSTVTFGGVAAASTTFVSATQLKATVATGSASGNVVVRNSTLSGTLGGLTYVPPTATPSGAAVTRVITDWNGYWNSNAATTTTANQPDAQHNMLAFGYGGTIYATGVNNATLTTNNVTFASGDFRALPISTLSGSTTASATSNNLVMAIKMDGNAAAPNYQAVSIANLTTRDVLIDGIKGLGLGSGVTNINTGATLNFTVNNIQSAKITDAEPDIVITQVADATSNVDLYCFTDADGNVIGKVLQANLSSITAVGTYRQDLFTLPANTAYNTATPSGNGTSGTKDIRLIAFKLSDFGIDDNNRASAVRFRVSPGGDSDIAFIAYNAGAITIPAPVINTQPLSQVVCPGTGGSATFSVAASGTGLSYQWKKNGTDIPGATSATYTISNVQAADIATYSVVVTNESGSVASNSVYLNTIISVQPVGAIVCLNTATTLSVTANGASLTYQWYSNTTASTAGGTLITNATNSTYSPPVNAGGTKYYYAVITNSGQGCASATTTPVGVTVNAAVAGTASITGFMGAAVSSYNTCAGTSGIVMKSTGASGASYQWEKSADGTTGWTNVTGGSGATTTSYTAGAMVMTTYYRLKVTTSTCVAYSATVTIVVDNYPGVVSGNVTICSGSTATISTTGATGNLIWQSSTDNVTWNDILFNFMPTYITPALTTTTYFRVRSNVVLGCPNNYSDAITVTVNPLQPVP